MRWQIVGSVISPSHQHLEENKKQKTLICSSHFLSLVCVCVFKGTSAHSECVCACVHRVLPCLCLGHASCQESPPSLVAAAALTPSATEGAAAAADDTLPVCVLDVADIHVMQSGSSFYPRIVFVGSTRHLALAKVSAFCCFSSSRLPVDNCASCRSG